MSRISIFSTFILLGTQLANYLIRQHYNIEEEKQPIDHKQKIIKRIFLFLLILIVTLLFIYSTLQLTLLIAIGASIFYTGYQSLVEYNYAQEEKQYIFHFVRMIGFAIIFISILFITQRIISIEEVVKVEELFDPGTVEQLEIENYRWNGDGTNERIITIEDSHLINRLFNTLFTLEVRESLEVNEDWEEFYSLNMQDQPIYYIDVSEKLINIGYTTYEIVGENPIYALLEEMEVDWEESAY
ncbi:hypothetical protein OBCHQ24_16915 [Oceanobacillus iheyensis]|nr:hypothetical protein OBCHQ24_16915 [Oceanobacillus iheyensis]